jgi:hypothetical protein
MQAERLNEREEESVEYAAGGAFSGLFVTCSIVGRHIE